MEKKIKLHRYLEEWKVLSSMSKCGEEKEGVYFPPAYFLSPGVEERWLAEMESVLGDIIRGVLVYVTLRLRVWEKPWVAVCLVKTIQRERKCAIKIHRGTGREGGDADPVAHL